MYDQQDVDPKKVRSIQMGEFLREYVSRRLLALSEGEIAALTTSMRRIGVGTPGAAALAIFSILAQEPAAAILQCHRQPSRGKARRLLVHAALWAPSMAERDIILEAISELPDPGETAPTRWPGQESPDGECGAPKRDRWRHRRGGEPRTQSCECPEKQTTFQSSSLPSHHFTTPLHARNHPYF